MTDLRILAYVEVLKVVNFHSSAKQYQYSNQACDDLRWWDYDYIAFKSSCDHHNIIFTDVNNSGENHYKFIMIMCSFCNDMAMICDYDGFADFPDWLGWSDSFGKISETKENDA